MMIQRKQSIWLLLASLIILLTLFIPYGIHTASGLDTNQIIEDDLTAKSNAILLSLTIVSSVLSFCIIFLFGNRKLQRNLCRLAILLVAGILGFQIYHTSQTALGNKIVIGVSGSKIYLGVVIPILSFIFLILAIVGINKDEKLIRDSDRLR